MSSAPVARMRQAARRQPPLSPFGSRDYRHFWIAGTLSFTGFSIQMLSRGWLMNEMTGSPFLVSMVAASMMLPMFFLSLVGGVLADRFNQVRMMVTAEAAMLGLFVVLAALVMTDTIQPWSLLVLSGINGIIFALIGPSRQTIVANLVPREQLRPAIGLNMVIFNASQIIGPAIGGVLISSFSTEVAFAVSTAFLVPSLVLYSTLRLRPAANGGRKKESPLAEIRSGFSHIAADPTLRLLILGAVVIVITVMPWQSLAPVFAEEVLGRGAGGLGTIVLSAGIGALIGTLVVISAGGRLRHDRFELLTGFGVIGAVAGFALAGSYPLAVVFAGLAGLTGAAFMVTNMTVIQLSVPDELRGRVVGVRFLVIGLQPVGMLTVGAVAEVIGPQWAVAGLALMGAVLFALVQLFARGSRPGAG